MTADVTPVKTSSVELDKQARAMIGMLVASFLVGMAVNLIGLPSETKGATKAITSALIGLHVLIAIGLAITAVRAMRSAREVEGTRNLVLAGAISIGVTFVVGILTMITESPWWSYLMAVGFVAAVLIYGRLLVSATPRP